MSQRLFAFVAGAVVAAMVAVPASSRSFCSVPIGGEGPHYAGGGGEDDLTWGPAALKAATDGTFWLVDTVTSRLLHYGQDCSLLGVVRVKDAVGITDMVPLDRGLVVLDSSAVTPAVLELDWNGNELSRYEVPENLRLGLSGLVKGRLGEVLVEREAGRYLSQLLAADGRLDVQDDKRLAVEGGVAIAQPADPTGNDVGRGFLQLPAGRIPVVVDNTLGRLSILDVSSDGTVTVVLEEVSMGDTLRVDQTVRRYDRRGRLLGAARVPIAGMFTYVEHGIIMTADGELVAAVTRPDRVELHHLTLQAKLPSILGATRRSLSDNGGFVSDGASAPGIEACITWNQIYNNALTYINNWTYFNLTNTDGACTNRVKPRYIGGAGWYSSVSYDWGGVDSVAGFSSLMASGYKAGDRDTTPSESCSRGVDCSGFVQQTWGIPSPKYNVCGLEGLSTSVQVLAIGDMLSLCGSHVVLFNGFASGGVYDFEATTYANYDRVVHMFSTYSRLNGYSSRRYINRCAG